MWLSAPVIACGQAVELVVTNRESLVVHYYLLPATIQEIVAFVHARIARDYCRAKVGSGLVKGLRQVRARRRQ